MKSECGRIGRNLRSITAVLLGTVLCGCSHVAVNKSPATSGEAKAVHEAMRRKDEIIFLSAPELDPHKPVLLLLHGATDDPSEMMGIVEKYRGKYDVLLYAYNYHQPIRKVAVDLNREMKLLRAKMKKLNLENLTVVTYSYSASVFRQAVLKADDGVLFSGVSLIQMVPTVGGSYLARGLKNPVAAWFTGLASKPSAVENPYGWIARELWGKAGNQKFYETIPPQRVQSILIEEDPHSVARIQDEEIQLRYRNGIGGNVVVIPKSGGATHEYFPSEPFALGYLQKALEASFAAAPPPHDPVGISRLSPAEASGIGLKQHSPIERGN